MSKINRTTEEEKIAKMISDSGKIYKKVSPNYVCNKCGLQGNHYSQDCLGIKRTTGIPRSFLKPATVDTPGAKINRQG